jgi:hypothetical protein
MKLSLLTCTLLFFGIGYGQNYFQQEVNYKIEVTLDDATHEINAFEQIEYHNNSNSVLDTLYFHLWPNAYKNASTALAKQLLKDGQTNLQYAKEKDRGFIDQLNFKVNEVKVAWEYWKGQEDIAILILNQPLNPGSSIRISTPFHVKIPLGEYSRLGHLGESYQMTQWYPKPAVFDANGWNPINYLSQGEFYSEFGSYDVSITLPKNYVVGATGDLQNENEIAWLDSLAVIGLQKYNTEADTTIPKEEPRIEVKFNFERTNENIDFPESAKALKTIRFKQSKVHDFAWFADKRFNVLSGEVVLPNTGKKVKTWAMFTDRYEDYWKNAIEYLNDGLFYYSKWNGDYPYEQCTAVDGALTAGGGMEYPNVTVIGNVNSARSLETVIVHEVGHNWFFGILGSNERNYPWMDEGINSFNEYRYIKTKYPSKSMIPEAIMKTSVGKILGVENYKHREENYLLYLINAREGRDQSCGLHSCSHTPINYGLMVYTKTALAFEYLQSYIGEEEFDSAMQNYYEQWKFKHPQPKDIQNSLEKSTNKNLDWFFKELINTNKKIDYSIAKVNTFDKYAEIKLKNKGGLAGPISISAFKDTSIFKTKWIDGFTKVKTIKMDGSGLTKFVLDYGHNIPEINRQNNFYNTASILPKIEPVDLDFIWSLEKPSKTQVFLSPYLNYNSIDKTIIGLSLHNKQILKKPFSYSFSPAYGSGSNSLVGKSSIRYSYLPYSKKIRAVDFKTSLERFHYEQAKMYTKVQGELNVNFLKKPGNSPKSNKIGLRVISISRTKDTDFILADLKHSYRYQHTLKTMVFDTKIQLSKEFTKLTLENLYSYTTEKRGSYNLRLFAGVFTNETNNSEFHLGLVQQQDYLYELGIRDRAGTDKLLSKQITTTDGGFVIGEEYRSNQWLMSANLQVPLVKKIKAYLNVAQMKANDTYSSHWDAGLILAVVPKRIEVFFPLVLPESLKTVKYPSNIRFTLNININDIIQDIRTSF